MIPQPFPLYAAWSNPNNDPPSVALVVGWAAGGRSPVILPPVEGSGGFSGPVVVHEDLSYGTTPEEAANAANLTAVHQTIEEMDS